MSGIIIAAVVVSCTGLLLGLFLGVMGKKFYVEVDQKEIDVRACGLIRSNAKNLTWS